MDSHASLTTDRPHDIRRALLAPVLVLATLSSSVISSFGAPLIPTIATDFDVPLATAQWTLTAALLVGAVVSPVFGRLGDGHLRRATLIIGLALVTLGGVLAALATSFPALLIGRAAQGIGLGLAPLAMAIAKSEAPPQRAGATIAVLSVSAGAGLGAGYPISGAIAGAWGLSAAYWFGALVSFVALLGVATFIPSGSLHDDEPRLDLAGALLLACALCPSLFVLSEGAELGWGSPTVAVAGVAGLIFLVAWCLHQLHSRVPLVQLRLLRHPSVAMCDVCGLVLGIAMYLVLPGVTAFVQTPSSTGFGFGASPVVAGLVLVPLSVTMMASSRILPLVQNRLGAGGALGIGCMAGALGCGYFAIFHDALWQSFAMSAAIGVGLGLTFAAIPGLIVASIPAREVGSALGFYQVVRFTGFALGSALTATLLSAHSGAGGEPNLSGYTSVLWTASGMCVLAAVISMASSRFTSQGRADLFRRQAEGPAPAAGVETERVPGPGVNPEKGARRRG